MLDGQRQYEAAEHERDDIIHVRFCNVVGRSDPEDREEEERGHGCDGHGDGIGEPPQEHP